MSSNRETFRKSERLCSLKAINNLFETGRSLNLRAIRVVYIISDSENENNPVRLLISVPKKIFKKAVDRNLVKRRIREAFRKNKVLLYEPLKKKNKKADIAIIWKESSILPYSDIENALKDIFNRLQV